MSVMTRIKASEKFYSVYRSPSYGTENYYLMPSFEQTKMPLVMTDGVKGLFTDAQCYWIGDIVASYMPKIRALATKDAEEFYVARITRNVPNKTGEGSEAEQDGHGALFSLDNGHEDDSSVKITQEIEYTDIKMNVKLYLQTDGRRWVLMCPEEY